MFISVQNRNRPISGQSEKFEETKEVIRNCKWKHGQYNDQTTKKENKRTNNDLQQNTTQKIKDRASRTPLKSGGGVNSGAPEG